MDGEVAPRRRDSGEGLFRERTPKELRGGCLVRVGCKEIRSVKYVGNGILIQAKRNIDIRLFFGRLSPCGSTISALFRFVNVVPEDHVNSIVF